MDLKRDCFHTSRWWTTCKIYFDVALDRVVVLREGTICWSKRDPNCFRATFKLADQRTMISEMFVCRGMYDSWMEVARVYLAILYVPQVPEKITDDACERDSRPFSKSESRRTSVERSQAREASELRRSQFTAVLVCQKTSQIRLLRMKIITAPFTAHRDQKGRHRIAQFKMNLASVYRRSFLCCPVHEPHGY